MPRNDHRDREESRCRHRQGRDEQRSGRCESPDNSGVRQDRGRDNGRSRPDGRSLSPRRDENRGHQDEAGRNQDDDRSTDDSDRPDAVPATSLGLSDMAQNGFFYRGPFVLVLRRRLNRPTGPDSDRAPNYGDGVCIGINGDNLPGVHDKLDAVLTMWIKEAGDALVDVMMEGIPFFHDEWKPNDNLGGGGAGGLGTWVISHVTVGGTEEEVLAED